jgi:hypothetical protein
MGLHNGFDAAEPVRPQPVGSFDVRPRVARVGTLGTGTLACPECDAPVALGTGPRRPHESLSCPFCGCAGALRDFLSLAAPTRPARVEVRLVFSPG